MRRIGEELMQHHADAEHGKMFSAKTNFLHLQAHANLGPRASNMKLSTGSKRLSPRVKFNEDISNVGNFSKSSASSRGPLVKELAALDSRATPRASDLALPTALLSTDLRNGTPGGQFAQTLQKHEIVAIQTSRSADQADQHSETIEDPGEEPGWDKSL